jgi:hypothetical protein
VGGRRGRALVQRPVQRRPRGARGAPRLRHLCRHRHPLLADPFLLFNSEDDKYSGLARADARLLTVPQGEGVPATPRGAGAELVRLTRGQQNWLGFTEDGNAGHGHGLGAGFARDLRDAFQNLLRNFAQETITDSSHLERLALLSDRVGRDTISDFATNLVKHYMCTYTEEFTKKHIDAELCDSVRPRLQ